MTIKNDAVLVLGLGLGLVLIAWYAKKQAGDAIDRAGATMRTAWESATGAGEAVIETATVAVEKTVEAVAPAGAALYDNRPPAGRGTKKTEYTPGDINDGAIY